MSVCHGDQQIGKYQPAIIALDIHRCIDAAQKHLPEQVEVPPGMVKQHSYSPGIHLVYPGFIRLYWLYILSCVTLFKLLVPSTLVGQICISTFQLFSAPIFLVGHIVTCSNCQAPLTDACS